VQAEAQIIGLGLPAPVLTEVETFACVESLLLEWIEARILDGTISDALDVTTRRKASFWALYAGEYQLRWTLLELAGQLLLTADRIAAELQTTRKDARAILGAYTTGLTGSGSEPALPWCVLDRHHRHWNTVMPCLICI
jgi:hypothetical protein